MQQFIVGQRWINDAQLSMGLGTVVETDFRTVKIAFMATGESFVYAKESVPLTRVKFAEGDSIQTLDNKIWHVLSVEEVDGLLMYMAKDDYGEQSHVTESQLNHFVQLNRPTERLFNGQTDRPAWFDLRYRTREQRMHLTDSPLFGLVGGRVSLIPHQLYIAHEVARRHAPRVLLADEVGLGKTIEAGMIVHQQVVMEQISRVLIVVPDSLVHQWLVEMRRRFNLCFSVFDARTMEDAKDESGEMQHNPFADEELVLCSLSFISSDPAIYKACRDAGWDMMVVDEAHHLKWSEEESSLEYSLIEQLAGQTPSVLLLTATPEQLGKSSHFARLRILDPKRFHDFDSFVEEEQKYLPIASAVKNLLRDDELSVQAQSTLEQVLEIPASELSGEIADEQKQQWVENLLDRHGTGRALFRNTRAAVRGFPERQVHVYPLETPGEYKEVLASIADERLGETQLLLHPELLYQGAEESGFPFWTDIDPRMQKLETLLKELFPKKVLVITSSADSAVDIVRKLKHDVGINATAFHEHMDLIERDRAAAFFADQSSGAQVMVCSEMGSEGRNFQFSQNLVLFDLPINPDLLEQRIGRLDRIGQKGEVNIHVLMLQNTAQHVMYHWYAEGLNALQESCPVGQAVLQQQQNELLYYLYHPEEDYSELVQSASETTQALKNELNQGRDRLLEYNSCRQPEADELCRLTRERDDNSGLQAFLESVFDNFGVEYEIHSENCYTLHQGSHMRVQLNDLTEEGLTVTYDRETALSYEDVVFLTWSHPLVTQCMDVICSGEFGNATVTAIEIPDVPRATILLECVYVLSSAEQNNPVSAKFMPEEMLHILIDQNGKRYERFNMDETTVDVLPKSLVRQVLRHKEKLLRNMVKACNKFAQSRTDTVTEDAWNRAKKNLDSEISRLKALRQVNPAIREDEVDFLLSQRDTIEQRLSRANLQLDALRVIVAK